MPKLTIIYVKEEVKGRISFADKQPGKKQTSERKNLVVVVRLGGSGGLFPHQPPAWPGSWSRCRAGVGVGAGAGVCIGVGIGVGVGVGGAAGFDLVDESFYGGKLLSQVTQVSLKSVELFVEVIQGLRQRLDPEHRASGDNTNPEHTYS